MVVVRLRPVAFTGSSVTTERTQVQARSARAAGRASRGSLVGHAADYGVLPATIEESGIGDGSFRLDLGGGRTLVLKRADAGLARALARYLETMGTAARTGVTPSLSEYRPATGSPDSRALAAVAKVTARARSLTDDLLKFRTALVCGDAARGHDSGLHRGLRGGFRRDGRLSVCRHYGRRGPS